MMMMIYFFSLGLKKIARVILFFASKKKLNDKDHYDNQNHITSWITDDDDDDDEWQQQKKKITYDLHFLVVLAEYFSSFGKKISPIENFPNLKIIVILPVVVVFSSMFYDRVYYCHIFFSRGLCHHIDDCC